MGEKSFSFALLSSSEAQRDRVKDELTENYRREDEKLEKIVESKKLLSPSNRTEKHNAKLDHYDHLKGSVTAFTHISARVVESRNRIRTLRRTIDECKTKLRCRRDELRKLWTESVQSKETLRLLDKMYRKKNLPEILGSISSSSQRVCQKSTRRFESVYRFATISRCHPPSCKNRYSSNGISPPPPSLVRVCTLFLSPLFSGSS